MLGCKDEVFRRRAEEHLAELDPVLQNEKVGRSVLKIDLAKAKGGGQLTLLSVEARSVSSSFRPLYGSGRSLMLQGRVSRSPMGM